MSRTSAALTDPAVSWRWLAAATGAAAVALAAPAPSRAQAPAQTPPVRPPAQAPTTAAQPQAVDPNVIKTLEQVGAYLRGLKVFEMTAKTSNDVVLDDSVVVRFDGENVYKVKSPDALFIDVNTDRKVRKYYYDGKTLTVYAPRMKYYAQVPAPNTIQGLFQKAADEYDVDLPLDDLFYWGTPQSGLDQLTSAQYVGYARVDGYDTDHYVFRQPGADWQLWVERGDRPLPRKMVITHTDQAERPQYEARMDWRLRPNFTADAFTFSPPADVKPIPLATVRASAE